MHFGQHSTLFNIHKVRSLFYISCMLAFLSSCKDAAEKPEAIGFKFPEQGQSFGVGEEVKVELDVPADQKVTAVDYLMDGKSIGKTSNAEAFAIKTIDLSLGFKLITAVVDNGTKKDTLTVNIVLKSAIKPEVLTYKVLHTYPHDTTSYTQGLEYHNGRFLESTGEYGESSLRWVELETGKAIQKIYLDKKYFAEGSALVDNKIILLTWKENIGFVYEPKGLTLQGTFPYQNSREGWGLTYDGKRLIKSDGTNRLWFLNKDNYTEESYVDVFDNNGQLDQLNELEYINGKIYANIYQSDKIAVIDPKSGAVEQYIDLTGILPDRDRFANTDVLNGIAWDAAGKRLFVTGKKFDKLFHIAIIPTVK